MLFNTCSRGLLACAAAVVCCHQCAAVEYYVRKSGDDGHSGRSKLAAFQTIQKAAQSASNGDTIYIGAGTYERFVRFDGQNNSKAATRIIADRDGRKTGDPGRVVLKQSGNNWKLVVANARNLTIDGLVFKSQLSELSSSYGCRVSGKSGKVTFSNCHFEDQAVALRSYGSGVSLLVTNCLFNGGSFGMIASHRGNAQVRECTFDDVVNSSYFHLPSSVVVARCKFSRNSPTGEATSRDLYIQSSNLRLSNSEFINSSTGVFGTSVNSATIDGCTFTGAALDSVRVTGTRLKLSNSQMRDGNRGVTLNDTNGKSPYLANILAERMQAGVVADQSDYSVRNVNLIDNTYGILQERRNARLDISRSRQLIMRGNDYAIYSHHDETNAGRLKLSNQDFRGNKVGIYAIHSKVNLYNCKFGGGRGGVFCNDSASVSIRSCDFQGDAADRNASEFGIYARSGDIEIRGTKSTNSRIGICIENTGGKSPRLRRVTSQDHAYAALFMRGGKWTYSGANANTFRNAEYGVLATNVSWHINNVAINGSGCLHPIVDREGTCSINGLTVKNVNGDGFRSVDSSAITASHVTLARCGQSGIYIHNCPAVSLDQVSATGCEDGVRIGGLSSGYAAITNSTLSDNTDSGLFLQGLSIDPTVNSNSTFNNNEYGILVEDAPLTINPAMGLTLSGNRTAVSSRRGSLDVDGVTIKNNQTCVHVWESELAVSGCTFSGSTTAIAAYVNGKCTIVDSVVEDSKNGLLLFPQELADEPILVFGVEINNISSTAIYVRSDSEDVATLIVRDSSIRDVEHGVVNANTTLVAERVVMDLVGGVGFHLESGTTNSLSACKVTGTGSSWGILSYADNVAVTGTRVDKCSGGIGFYGGESTMVNSVINDCSLGLHLNAADGQTNILHSTIANIGGSGVVLDQGDAMIRNSIVVADAYSFERGLRAGSLAMDHNLVYSLGQGYQNAEPGEGDINKRPVFVNAATGDLRLSSGSPAINSAKVGGNVVATDFAGNRRPSFRGYEMGAYEYMNPGGSLRILNWDEVAKQ